MTRAAVRFHHGEMICDFFGVIGRIGFAAGQSILFIHPRDDADRFLGMELELLAKARAIQISRASCHEDEIGLQLTDTDGVQGTLINRPQGGRRPAGYNLLWVKNGVIHSLVGRGDPSTAVALADSLE